MKQLDRKQKIIIISVVLVFIALFGLLFFFQPNNNYGKGIAINNYDKYVSNLPADSRNSINTAIYKIVKNNLKTSDINVSDATIRKGSATYNYNASTNVNSGSFIVDMQTIKQSYLISYEWSSDDTNVNLSGYTSAASCLPANELIYGDFNCVDSFSNSITNINRDPILDHLPYSTFNYTVTASMNAQNKVDLNVSMILYSSDTRDGNRDNSINKYKVEIVDWIQSIGLNPANYLINYSIN